MSASKFKFVSPGVFVEEIDQSKIPAATPDMGPVIIGRTRRGPGFKPTKVNSFSEFIETFGNPVPGVQGGDVWRDGNYISPTYAAYAAQAWLKNRNGLTFVRLLGDQHPQATTAGEAGWKTTNSIAGPTSTGGAYGLFVIASSSTAHGAAFANHGTASLAAVWYMDAGTIELSGNAGSASFPGGSGGPAFSDIGNSTYPGCAVMVANRGTQNQFKAIIRTAAGAIDRQISFDFNENSDLYIRKVFNTNPTLANSDITSADQQEVYWLGETYERNLRDGQSSGDSAAGTVFGVILGLMTGTTAHWSDKKGISARPAQTGWVFSQHMNDDVQTFQPQMGASSAGIINLFKFHALYSGEWEQKNFKISIANVKSSKNKHDEYGSFDVLIRRAQDNDSAPQIVERFSSCNLNPYSSDYVAKRIGNRNVVWDHDEKRYREYGDYENRSRHIRIELNKDVHDGKTDARLVPFGFYGPIKPRTHLHCPANIVGGLTGSSYQGLSDAVGTPRWLAGSGTINQVSGGDPAFAGYGTGPQNGYTWGADNRQNMAAWTVSSNVASASMAFTCSFAFPSLPQRTSASDGNVSNPKEAYFGVDTTKGSSTQFEKSYYDMVRLMPDGVGSFSLDTAGDATEYHFIFSLDELSSSYPTANALTQGVYKDYLSGGVGVHVSGSRFKGTSYTALGGTFDTVLKAGYDKFTLPLHGGFDGFDITEADPFRNSAFLSTYTERTWYPLNSVKRAIDACADPEVVEFNLASAPGITADAVNLHLVDTCENRGDALAVIDIADAYKPASEGTDSEAARRSTVDDVVTTIKNLGVNSSYACTYYPWVQIRDTQSGASLWAPPSVVALGTFASSEKNSELWFAPAGFTRGGLTDGAAGVPVVNVRERLMSKERDKLYEANINPIASFPNEGIVVFGQKTLQTRASALDRINVRRLMIYVKKTVSRMAKNILFDQNTKTTWLRFINLAEPFLKSIQTRLGLQDFKFILDESTTTTDLIDRNIVYAKVFLKPTRAIEFIAVDFVITDSGASFED